MSDAAHPPAAPTACFVYGTLMPGHLRWPLLAPFADGVAAAHRPAVVPGRLFDTGCGYPAARFDLDHPTGALPTHPLRPGPAPAPAPGEVEVVHGVTVHLRPTRLAAALEVLDLVEGDEYDRIIVRTDAGEPCWAYEWRGPTAGLPAVTGGRWTGV